MDIPKTLTGAAFALTLAILAAPVMAAETSANTLTVAGHVHSVGGADCGTSGPPGRLSTFFNTGVNVPLGGHGGCQLAGAISEVSHAAGPSFSSQDVTSAFIDGTAILSASARADYGSLGVKAVGTYSGATSAFIYHAADASAYFTDSLTLSGTGTGFIKFGFGIDGSSMTVGPSQVLTFLNYQFDKRPLAGVGISAFVSSVDLRNITSARSPTAVGGVIPGFNVSPGSVNGSGEVFTFLTAVDFGTAYNLAVGLYTASYPGTFGGVANSDFFSTAKLNSISVFDAAGNPVDFRITSGSGTLYDQFGAHPLAAGVPEPASWALMIAGFAIVGVSARRRIKIRGASYFNTHISHLGATS
jgi:PEP-CTERM motif